jgi:hypothetical protein
VLDDCNAKLENSPIELVTESLDGYLIAIGVRWTGEFACGVGYLAPYFELSIARSKERAPEMALFGDSVPEADQLLPSVDILLT